MEKENTQTQRIIDNHGNITQDGDIFDLKGANIKKLTLNNSLEERVVTNYFFKNYLEYRNRKGKSVNITIIKYARIIFYSLSILFGILSVVIFLLARNNILTVDQASDSLIFTFSISFVFALLTFIHYKIEKDFDKIKILKLSESDKGRIYFTLDCIYFIVILFAVIFFSYYRV